MDSLESIADQFFHAFYERAWGEEWEHEIGKLSVAEAYEVQRLVAEQRVRSGEKVVGYKVGCTSGAIQSQFGLNEPICARLFDPHLWEEEGGQIDWTAYANCAIEPEMVFKIGRDLSGHEVSDQELLDAIEYVSPGVELHHYTFWCGKPTLQELICSGGIHAGLVIGKNHVSPHVLNFRDEIFSVRMSGKWIASSPASEILGGPLHSLRWLVSFLTARGESLKQGAWVIPGSPTELIEIHQDTQLTVAIDRIGSMDLVFGRIDRIDH